MNAQVLPLLIFLSGAAHIALELLQKRKGTYLTKPLTMISIICWLLFRQSIVWGSYQSFILAGLIFSLAGDVFLMLPKEKFIAGLISFLIAHLFYTYGFYAIGANPPLYSWVIFGAISAVVLKYLWSDLGFLKPAVFVYLLAILSMGVMAYGTLYSDQLPVANQSCIFAGAILFMFSDTCLAIRKFQKPLPLSPLLVMGTYFMSQWLIAISAIY